MSEQSMRKPKTQTNKPINTDLFNRATVAQDVISAIIYPITIVIIGIIRTEAPAGTVARAIIGVHRQCQSQVHAMETTRKIHHIVKRSEHLVNIRSGDLKYNYAWQTAIPEPATIETHFGHICKLFKSH